MAGIGIIAKGNFGNTGMATGAARIRNEFVGTATRAFVLDASIQSSLWQDTAGTVPVTALGQPVRRIDDKSGQNRHAVLRAGATGVPTWQGAGAQRWVQMPNDSGFEVANPIGLTSWSVVGAVSIGGVVEGATVAIVSQAGAGNAFLALQIGRAGGKLSVNLADTVGYELQGPALPLDAPHSFSSTKNVATTTATAAVDGAGLVSYTGAFSNPGAQLVTNVFYAPSNPAGTTGRLYYLAFVNAVRDPTPLERIAASKAGIVIP